MIHHPAALRNRIPIAETLTKLLSSKTQRTGRAIEFGSGTGCHLEYFAPRFPDLTWLPSEYVPPTSTTTITKDEDFEGDLAQRSLSEIDEVLKDVKNCEKAVPIDVSKPLPKSIPRNAFALVYTCNVFHITPRAVGRGVVTNAAKALRPGGSLVIYGPFKLDGKCNNESNREFDASLRAQNKEWGYWDINDITKEARKVDLTLSSVTDMPKNNYLLHYTYKK